MLEVVDVTAGINRHIIIFMEHRQQALLHIKTFGFLLACLGVDGVVTHHDDPVFVGIL